jgi:Uma2 family endonuclease
MAVPGTFPQLTEAEYLAFDRQAGFKSEFFGGEIFAMAGGSAMHSLIAANLIRHLGNQLRGGSCKVFTSDLRLKILATGLLTYPDTSVVCGQLEYVEGTDDTILNPTLIVEVLSDSTEGYDRGEKFRQYQQMPALKEYLLVSQRLPRIEQYLRGGKDEWTLRSAEGLASSLRLPSVEITLELSEVFAGVDFQSAPFRRRI